jgi:NitT/TauT family transport system substrate-binding protein
MFLAESLGFYGDEPIQLLSFLSSTEVIRAYRNRAIDVAAVTADEALLLVETMPDQRIILVCDVSHGADVILTKPGFPTFMDLRGRRIGVESGALGAYVLARALEVNRMEATEVTVETVPLNEHDEAFRSGRVDALVTFEPVRSRLIADGAHQVFSSSQIPGEIVDVLITRAELVEDEAHLLHALVRGWFRALSRMKSHPEESARTMAIREQTTPEGFLASLQLLRLPDRASNRELLEGSQTNLVGALHRLARSMAQHRLIAHPPETSNILESRFIPPTDP